jgi:hypothetical protein
VAILVCAEPRRGTLDIRQTVFRPPPL